MSGSSADSDFRFEADICEPRKLIPMFKAIHIMKHSMLTITCRGLKLTCEDCSKSLQANSFIDRSLFVHYYMSNEDNPVSVCIQLSDVLKMLTIMGVTDHTSGGLSTPVLRISYVATTDKLTFRLKEESFETKARIKTFDSEEMMVLVMNSSNKVILNAESIVEFWKGADLSSDYIEVSMFGREQYLQWATLSERGRFNHKIHSDSEDVEQFLHSNDVSKKYNMSLMKTSLRALIYSSKMSVRVDEGGLLSLQFMIKLDQTEIEHCFVEYFIVPEVELNES